MDSFFIQDFKYTDDPNAWRILALLPGEMQIKQQGNIPIHPSRGSLLRFAGLHYGTAPPIHLSFRESNEEPMYRYISLV